MKKHVLSLLGLTAAFALAFWLLFDVGLSRTSDLICRASGFSCSINEKGDASLSLVGQSLQVDGRVLEAGGYAWSEGCRLYRDLMPAHVTFAAGLWSEAAGGTMERLNSLLPENQK